VTHSCAFPTKLGETMNTQERWQRITWLFGHQRDVTRMSYGVFKMCCKTDSAATLVPHAKDSGLSILNGRQRWSRTSSSEQR
jgi:hypothetical protein